MELMRVEIAFFARLNREKTRFPAPVLRGDIMMSDEQLHKVLSRLKAEECVPYTYIARISNIDCGTLYFYRRCKHYPVDKRIQIEEAIRNKFGGLIDELSK